MGDLVVYHDRHLGYWVHSSQVSRFAYLKGLALMFSVIPSMGDFCKLLCR